MEDSKKQTTTTHTQNNVNSMIAQLEWLEGNILQNEAIDLVLDYEVKIHN